MPYSPARIINEAMSQAVETAGDANASQAIDAAYVAETLLPQALKEAVLIGATIPNEAASLRREFALTFVNGVIALPSAVLEECLDQSNLFSASDGSVAELSSYQSRYLDFLRESYSQLGYYTVNGVNLEYREPSGLPKTFNGPRTLSAIAVPAYINLTSNLDMPNETALRTIRIIVGLIRNG